MRSSSVRAVDFHMQIKERSFCSIWDCWLGLVEDAAPPVGRMAAIMVSEASVLYEKNAAFDQVT